MTQVSRPSPPHSVNALSDKPTAQDRKPQVSAEDSVTSVQPRRNSPVPDRMPRTAWCGSRQCSEPFTDSKFSADGIVPMRLDLAVDSGVRSLNVASANAHEGHQAQCSTAWREGSLMVHEHSHVSREAGSAAPTLSTAIAGLRGADCVSSLLLYKGKVASHDATILVDGGSSANFISRALVERAKIKTRDAEASKSGFEVLLADGSSRSVSAVVDRVKLKIGDYVERLRFHVLELRSQFDVILGKPWLASRNDLQIDWKDNVVSFRHEGRVFRLRTDSRDESSPDCESNLVSSLQIKKAARQGCDVFACLVTPIENPGEVRVEQPKSDGLTASEAKHVDELLLEYRDRGVEHRIELEPGSSPP